MWPEKGMSYNLNKKNANKIIIVIFYAIVSHTQWYFYVFIIKILFFMGFCFQNNYVRKCGFGFKVLFDSRIFI